MDTKQVRTDLNELTQILKKLSDEDRARVYDIIKGYALASEQKTA